MIDKVLKALVIYWRHLKFKKRQKGDIGIRSEAANTNNLQTQKNGYTGGLVSFFFIALVIVSPLGIVRSKFLLARCKTETHRFPCEKT